MGNFTFSRQRLHDVIVIQPRVFRDGRGQFSETYSLAAFAQAGIDVTFVQDNQSLSLKAGTIRGLHFQTSPHAQAKLVRVLAGVIFDVAVDLRRSSPSYGQWCAACLSAEGGEQMFVPRGFAHGFCTLADNTLVSYKVDNYYEPQSESGLIWSDPDLAIDWPAEAQPVILSDKDQALPDFRTFRSPFE